MDASPDRAEYLVMAHCVDASKPSLEIADPDLRFRWTKNTSTVTRFDYDGYSRRWMPLPGSVPDEIGSLSNVDRLSVPIPDLDDAAAPFSLYVGFPVRLKTFSPTLVASFGTPATGVVEIHRDTGELNFSSLDVSSYEGQTVFMLRQSYFSRTGSSGLVGSLPASTSSDYRILLNPRPATGQTPLVRIGYGRHLTAVEVPNESSFGSPAPGSFQWALDTGRIKLSDDDVATNGSERVYFDGTVIGDLQLVRHPFTAVGYPSSVAVSGAPFDYSSIIVFAEDSGGKRVYFIVSLTDSHPSRAPSAGNAYLDDSTGLLYLSPSDVSTYAGWSFYWIDVRLGVENGVAIQLYRSGANGSGESRVDDFSISYEVGHGDGGSAQLLEDGLGGSPLVLLPIRPVVDGDLEFSIKQGPGSSGRFTGNLVDGSDPTQFGIGYLLNLDDKQLTFSNRKTVTRTLLKSSPSIKLDDAAMSERGFELTLNGTPLVAGTDFDFDYQTGLIEFTDPVGENDLSNVYGISGTTVADTFTTAPDTFFTADVGKLLFIQTGDGQGLYEIVSTPSSNEAVVSPSFPVGGTVTADIRSEAEIIVDRLWEVVSSASKKFSLYRAPSPSGPFSKVDDGEYGLFYNVGQINLATPARPGEAFQINYTSLDSDDEGVTVSPTQRTEMALFSIRQEDASFTVGSKKITFNSDGHVVSTDRNIVVRVAGVTQDANSFQFTAPGTILLKDAVSEGPVVVNYWVEDAAGGETTIDLQHAPVDYDPLSVSQGDVTLTVSGDQTDTFVEGGVTLVNDKDALSIKSVSYDSSSDLTVVTFDQPASFDADGVKACGPVDGQYEVTETSDVDMFVVDTNEIRIVGDRPYLSGMIVKVDGDPYLVVSVTHDSSSNLTKLSTAAPARRNYVIPTLTRTVRPVYDPGTEFQTSRSAHLDYGFTLVKGGTSQSVLTRDVDYTVVDGGSINLVESLGAGETLRAMYVARDSQAAGSELVVNYAYAISPNDLNGLEGQRLYAAYNLYAPDTFFFRIESVETFLPEIADGLSSSSQTGSGPAIESRVSLRTKDFGDPSPYFDEQHYENVDAVVARLLKFYNDLINDYEDILSNIDGRVVGGTDGRFRFDGNLDNPPRLTADEVTNDIDDDIVLYYTYSLTSLSLPFSFSRVPVYGGMWQKNKYSRIFPTEKIGAAAINDKTGTSDFGEIMGAFVVENLRRANPITSMPANAEFTNSVASGSNTKLFLVDNGDPDLLIPPLEVGNKVTLYKGDGSPSTTAEIVGVTTSPLTVTVDVSTTITRGSVLVNSSDPDWRSYMNGRDLSIDGNGQIVNVSFNPALQETVEPNEIVKTPLTFDNQDLQPLRFPALDGSELTDDELASMPRLRRQSESRLLERELLAIGSVGEATIPTTADVLEGVTISLTAGDVIRFVDGPNAGQQRTVDSILSPTSVRVTSGFISLSSIARTFETVTATSSLSDVLTGEIGVIATNVEQFPPYPGGAKIGNVNSEILSVVDAIISFGKEMSYGTGGAVASGLTWTDATANFVDDDVRQGDLLYVSTGDNRGLYLIDSVATTSVTVDDTLPYVAFPTTGSSTYHIINPWPFLGSSEFAFASEFLRNTLKFLNNTNSWATSPTSVGKSARLSEIHSRQSQLTDFTSAIEAVLGDGDGLYDSRYLWIQQRTDQEEGTLIAKQRAVQERLKTILKIVQDQRKLLITNALQLSLG